MQPPTAWEQFWQSIERASSPTGGLPSAPRSGGPVVPSVGHVVAECCDQALSLLSATNEPLSADDVLGILRAIGSLGSGTDPHAEVLP